MPPWGGVPYCERLEEEAEALLGLLVGEGEQPEDPGLQARVVDTDAAAADLACR